MTIGIDMMGGDYAPLEAVKGLKLYLATEPGPSTLVLIGDKPRIEELLIDHELPAGQFMLVHADQVIDMHEHPARALKEKPHSSVAIGFKMLAAGETDAFISAGHTGAMLVGAVYSAGVMKAVIRPVISSIIPKAGGGSGLLLDVGLNADCKPEQLNQFALMGSVYAQAVLDIQNPRVGLINVGEEETKGNLLAQSAYPLLKNNPHINFAGNVEGRDILTDKCDVMVCDGFTGNIILKMAESLYHISQQKNIKDEYFERFNFEIYGGTPVLGISKPVIIGHGISHAKAFKNMISLAGLMLEKKVMDIMKERLQA